MKTDGFTYEVGMLVEFTDDELGLLRACCAGHYDRVVRSSGQPGGFLYGWLNMLLFEADEAKTTVAIKCSPGQLDTCAKALEQLPLGFLPSAARDKARWDLQTAIVEALRSLGEEYSRLNPRLGEERPHHSRSHLEK